MRTREKKGWQLAALILAAFALQWFIFYVTTTMHGGDARGHDAPLIKTTSNP